MIKSSTLIFAALLLALAFVDVTAGPNTFRKTETVNTIRKLDKGEAWTFAPVELGDFTDEGSNVPNAASQLIGASSATFKNTLLASLVAISAVAASFL
eukprot:CAMPEP_0194210690 /NCGR_PEP_ID=MMETSP0156-20130528/8957_1 /TAXON_ID=33649 /ORGANISM="Thalassionema nitzschioides, Strain L26-B" /LENGTH=97 /DNA_ID=CAMNT_0038938065 /DNA_START=97 /DNA_END=390 /DNA_ORIENTATION=+